MDERHAYIVLNMIEGIGPKRVQSLINVCETANAVFELDRSSLMDISGINDVTADAILSWDQHVNLDHELEVAERGGVDIVTLYDDDYPDLLREIYDAPLCLYIRGNKSLLSTNAVAVVGSRRATLYGREVAKHLAESASYADWSVVSGLAYGIDGIAHKACVDAKGKTIAVLGGGLAHVHPQDHIPLARRIIDSGGAIVSEFPMDYIPNKKSFPIRNRVISGLCYGTIIVEAARKSGALITASCALEQGRMVYAVPGQINSPMSQGCNRLIKDGASVIESFDDVLDSCEFAAPFYSCGMYAKPCRQNVKELKKGVKNLKLSEDEAKICGALENGSLDIDDLADICDIHIGRLMGLLSKLCIMSMISEQQGQRYALTDLFDIDKE